MILSTIASLGGVTEGIGSVLFGLLRPLCWLALAVMAYKATLLSPCSKRLMVIGAIGNFTASIVFLFINADFAVPGFWSDYAQLVATPSTVAFTLGFAMEAIKLGGLKVSK